jgi:nicotinate-nucleotide adenylyltransferase
MQKRAIFGGTFNPIHWGHLLIAETALDQEQLDQVIWVPSYHPPHRSTANLTDVGHRIEMVKQAIAPHPSFTLSTVEREREGTSYAINTLNDLKHLYPDCQWYWIIGLDAFQSLPRWYRNQELAGQCGWLVVPRLLTPDFGPPARENLTEAETASTVSDRDSSSDMPVTSSAASQIQSQCETVANQMHQRGTALSWKCLQMPLIEISSSLIRQYCRDRRSIRYLVPDPVLTYIKEHNLYLGKS